jgi:ribosome-binding protein aMBF1 (putative translation factor)
MTNAIAEKMDECWYCTGKGKALRALRESHGWSRAELSRRTGLNPNTIGLIESGRLLPYKSQAQKLQTALGVILKGNGD